MPRIHTSRLAVVCALALAVITSVQAERRLANGWEVRSEITLPAGVDPSAVRDFFPTFQDYIDTVLFHPSAGYYSSGRVDFYSHYRTFPIALAPSFGQMIAEQIFRMWDGMRKAGSLSPTEKFTIAEFGPGNGALAESILNYIDSQAAGNVGLWREFSRQVVYASYDRSTALSDLQTKRNSRFGHRFEARVADATNPGATIPSGSLKGVVLSNELLDCFSVHKVVLGEDGSAEVAYVVPSFWRSDWEKLRAALPASVRELVSRDDTAIRHRLLAPKRAPAAPEAADRVYLSRTAFNGVLEAISKRTTYEMEVNKLQFQELYVPVSVTPEVAGHIRRYASVYANRLARAGLGLVTYVSPGARAFIHGAGAALKAGYVITIDYGDNWDGILSLEFDHLRMFGPGALSQRANPYQFPTLNDMTTDANFSHIATEGESVGLNPVYFGPQRSLIVGTPIKLDPSQAERTATEPEALDYFEWADSFYTWETYKVLVQQKQDTDPSYTYPQDFAKRLTVSDEGLTPAHRARIADLTKALIQSTNLRPGRRE